MSPGVGVERQALERINMFKELKENLMTMAQKQSNQRTGTMKKYKFQSWKGNN